MYVVTTVAMLVDIHGTCIIFLVGVPVFSAATDALLKLNPVCQARERLKSGLEMVKDRLITAHSPFPLNHCHHHRAYHHQHCLLSWRDVNIWTKYGARWAHIRFLWDPSSEATLLFLDFFKMLASLSSSTLMGLIELRKIK